MKRSLTRAVAHAVGETVMLRGFVDTLRDQKHVLFLMLCDATGCRHKRKAWRKPGFFYADTH